MAVQIIDFIQEEVKPNGEQVGPWLYTIKFVWKYVIASTQPVQTLTISLSTDKTEYVRGDNPALSGLVKAGNQPAAGANVRIDVLQATTNRTTQLNTITGSNGYYSISLAYGTHIPSGYTGNLNLSAAASYQGTTATAEKVVYYGKPAAQVSLSVTVSADKSAYTQGEEALISGRVALEEEGLEDATVILQALSETGQTLSSTQLKPSFDGGFNWSVKLPTYTGKVKIVAQAKYGTAAATADKTVTFTAAPPAALKIELFGPTQAQAVGSQMGIAGIVTQRGSPVGGANVRMEVLGKTYTTSTWDKGTDAGHFAWDFNTTGWPSGTNTVKVTVAKQGMGSIEGTITFTLIGEGNSIDIALDLAESYQVDQQITIKGRLTLQGRPLQQTLEVNIKSPNGELQNFKLDSNSEGKFLANFRVRQLGTHTITAVTDQDGIPISRQVSFKGIAPPSWAEKDWKITDVDFPRKVQVGDTIKVRGRLIRTEDGKPYPQPGWFVGFTLYCRAPFSETWTATDSNGAFSLPVTLTDFTCREIQLFASAERGGRNFSYYDSIDIRFPVTVDVRTEYTDYNQGEILNGQVRITNRSNIMEITNPQAMGNSAAAWNENMESVVTITGPTGGDEKTYTVSARAGLGINPATMNFTWSIPELAEPGMYRIRATVSGPFFDNAEGQGSFYVKSAIPTNFEALLAAPADPRWMAKQVEGKYEDYQGAPIPGAQVKVVAKTRANQNKTVELTGVTDQDGRFSISGEPLDLASDGGPYGWEVTASADKPGYATGTHIIGDTYWALEDGIVIVSADPAPDYLIKMADSINYQQPLPFSARLKIKYNALSSQPQLAVASQGNWEITGDRKPQGNCGPILRTNLSINGVRMPDVNYDKFEKYNTAIYGETSQYRGTVYYLPVFRQDLTLARGIGQESEVTVQGALFNFNNEKKMNNPCCCYDADSAPDDSSQPRDWASGASISVGIVKPLGDKPLRDEHGNPVAEVVWDQVDYPIYKGKEKPEGPQVSIAGTAWCDAQNGELKLQVKYGTGKALSVPNCELKLEPFERDLASGMEKPSSLLIMDSSARTDKNGHAVIPLKLNGDPCGLATKSGYYIKSSLTAAARSANIPVELRCTPKIDFGIAPNQVTNKPQVVVVQATQLTDIPSAEIEGLKLQGMDPLHLASFKPAGVRVYLQADGDIYQPSARPAKVKVRLVATADGKTITEQEKLISIDEKGASVGYAPFSAQPNSAGLGTVASWTPAAGIKQGTQVIPVDFVFTPVTDSTMSVLLTKITVDPDKKFGPVKTHSLSGLIEKMKQLQLLFVPVDVTNVDTEFINQQVKFLAATYPVAEGDIRWSIAPNYPSKDMSWRFTFTYAEEIALNLLSKYANGGAADSEYRIVGIIDDATWKKGLIDRWAGISDATGCHYPSVNQVVLVRYPNSKILDYNLAHELGHSFGLYSSRYGVLSTAEQYDYKDNRQIGMNNTLGLEVHGHVLSDGAIHLIPATWTDKDVQWKTVFGLRGKQLESTPLEVYDLMGHADGVVLRAWVHPYTYAMLFPELEDPPGSQVLLVRGIFSSEGKITLEPVWTMEGTQDELSHEGDYQLQVCSSAGEVLYGTRFGRVGTTFPFAIAAPFLPGTARIVILNENTVVTELLRSPNKPVVQLSPETANASGSMRLKWEAQDADGDTLTYGVFFRSANGNWTPVDSNLKETGYSLDTSKLPGGKDCVVRVMATDGFNTGYAISQPFTIDAKPPIVTISNQHTSYPKEEPVALGGSAYDPEEGYLNNELLQWSSDKDGVLGKGRSIDVMLTPGKHTVTLTATDSAGAVGQDTIEINVGGWGLPIRIEGGKIIIDIAGNGDNPDRWVEIGAPECFIATAAYGSETAAELDTLRAFRDKVLMKNEVGEAFVRLYYQTSPPLARFIAEHELIRTLVREVMLNPVVHVLEANRSYWNN